LIQNYVAPGVSLGTIERGATMNILPITRELYPSYKSFDDFIALDKLLQLDGYLQEKLTSRALSGSDDLFVNAHCLEDDAPMQPGVREVWLKRTSPERPYDYLDIDKTELWKATPEAGEFAELTHFISTLPFESTGRILLIYDTGGHPVPAHRDHETPDICHDFIWFRTNLRKPFYLLNPTTGQKLYVEGYSAWFDTVNQYHGSDATEGDLTFSFRVDGRFTAEFRENIPYLSSNASATPAVWAAAAGGQAR